MILKTHEMIPYLEGHGFTNQQAEALVDWQTKIFAATAGTRLHKSDLKSFERRFTINLVMAHLTGAAITVGLLKFFF